MIMNTDRSGKKGTQWWSLLELHTRKHIFLFDSFGFTGFKEFIINNDKKIIDKLLYGLKNFNRKDNRIIVPVNFLVESYERESQSSKSNLTDTAKDFFLHD